MASYTLLLFFPCIYYVKRSKVCGSVITSFRSNVVYSSGSVLVRDGHPKLRKYIKKDNAMPNARVYTSALLRLLYDRTSSAAQRDGFERPGVALLKIMVSNSYPGSKITSREVNEARRPHTCSRPCAFEEKKKHEITGNSLIVAHTKE